MDIHCEKCGKTFAIQSRLERHRRGKRGCTAEDKNSACVCENCGRSFSTKSNLTRHLANNCRVIEDEFEEMLEILLDGQDRLLQQQAEAEKKQHRESRGTRRRILELENQLKQLLFAQRPSEPKLASPNNEQQQDAKENHGAAFQGNNNSHNSQNVNSNNNNVTLNVFGKENMSMITIDTISKLAAKAKTPNDLAMSLVDLVYTDKANQNAHVPNKKEPDLALVFEGDRWVIKATSEVAETITRAVGAAMERTIDPLSKVTLDILDKSFDLVVITKGETAHNSKEVAKALAAPMVWRLTQNRPDKPIKL